MRRLFALAAAVFFAAGVASAATPELRGTWVTTTNLSTGNVATAATTATNFARLRAIGLNTVYMDAWRNGETYFKSDTMKAFGGTQLASALGTRDLFAETLIQSHRNGMSQYAWMQYGFAAQYLAGAAPSNALAIKAKNNGWLLQDQSGNYSGATGNKYAWMNPLVPEVQDFVIGLGVELVKKYDVDGIEFDDRLAWPTQFGFDAYTKGVYKAETGRDLPASATDSAFTLWRSQKITAFAQKFSAAIRAANPNAKVAAAPGIATVYSDYAVDAPAWAASTVAVNGVTRPTFDEITPQVYSSTTSYFTGALNNSVTTIAAPAGTLYAPGISVDNSAGAAYDWATVNKVQVDTQRQTAGTSGHIWWYSNSVLGVDESKLTSYYNVAALGQAARPDRAADYRPAPVTTTALANGIFSAAPATLARYSVIGLSGTTWTELLNTVLPNASINLALGSYSKVELLIDRRGFIAGDANFDGMVDQTDLAAWKANYGKAGMWAQADFTLDGVVNDADLAVLGSTWGTGVTGALPALATLVPEPTMVAGIALCAVITRRRRSAF